MPRFGTRTLLAAFAVVALWMSTFTGYAAAGDVRATYLTVWIAIGCFLSRLVFIDLGLRPEHVSKIVAVLALVLTPFAAVGAIFDRMGLGILCGMSAVAVIALLSLGVR